MRLRAPLRFVPGPPAHLRGGERDLILFEGDVEPWLPELFRALDGRDTIELPGIAPALVDAAVEKLRSIGALETESALASGETLTRAISRLADSGAPRVVHEDVLAPSELARINREMLASERPWFLASLQGSWARVGPLFVPSQTCCWECYRARLESNRAHRDAYTVWAAMDVAVGYASTPAHEAVVAGLVASELRRTTLAGRVFILDLETLDATVETVWTAPYCPACRA